MPIITIKIGSESFYTSISNSITLIVSVLKSLYAISYHLTDGMNYHWLWGMPSGRQHGSWDLPPSLNIVCPHLNQLEHTIGWAYYPYTVSFGFGHIHNKIHILQVICKILCSYDLENRNGDLGNCVRCLLEKNAMHST